MDDAFADFPSVPVDLAPAALVRRRGEQRRARARVAVGAAMAMVVVVAVGGTAVALTDGAGKPDSLVPADTPSATTEPSASPEPTAIAAPDDAPVSDAGIVSPAALLQPSDAAEVAGGTWARGLYGYGPEVGLGPLVCEAAPDFGTSAGYAVQLQSGQAHVLQQVLRFASAERATEVHERVRYDVTRCARRAADSESGTGYAENRPVALAGGAVGLAQKAADCAECTSTTRYWAVVAVGPYLGYLAVESEAELQAWSDAMTERLAACATGSCLDLELPPASALPIQVLLHEGDQLWTVTIGIEPEGAPTTATMNEQARYNARLLGYVTRIAPASCLEGLFDPQATVPETDQLVTVSFGSQEDAAAFREAYRSVGGGVGEPRLVTAVCPVG